MKIKHSFRKCDDICESKSQSVPSIFPFQLISSRPQKQKIKRKKKKESIIHLKTPPSTTITSIYMIKQKTENYNYDISIYIL